ncbi:MAG: DUF5009 domain-containing protein [Ignavibacteriaceae bacterium]|nr:DUF5009 domain-containing protein [Ignavibacteriaceae bacterium]
MSTNEPRRALALDALRGFAILTMILSSRIPYGVLPGWMYHVQVPPPIHKFNAFIPGISWVDLVFPFFLFSMGAAFPFALTRRLNDGSSKVKVIWQIIYRGLLLMFFALAIQHMRPHVIDPAQPTSVMLLAILMFVFTVLFFLRYPENISKKLSMSLKGVGLIGLILFLFLIRFPDGSGFSFRKYDIIILVLSNVAIVGSLIWFYTPNNISLRLAIMAFIVGIRLSNTVEGSWIQSISSQYPGYLLFQLNFLKYLLIVIPGTIAGDIILSWMKKPVAENENPGINKCGHWLIVVSMLSLIVVSLVGLYTRLVGWTMIVSIVLGLYSIYILRDSKNSFEKMIRLLFHWGFIWIILGLLFEPFEGGIKKDHSTLSYYFLTSGLAIALMIAFFILDNALSLRKSIQVLIDNGQNPMLAYVAGTNLLTPVVTVTYLDKFLQSLFIGPWPGVIKGIIVTGLLAMAVSFFTKKKLFLRT